MIRRIILVHLFDQAEMMSITRDKRALYQGLFIVIFVAVLGSVLAWLAADQANQNAQLGETLFLNQIGENLDFLFGEGVVSQLIGVRQNPVQMATLEFLLPFFKWGLWSIIPFLIGTGLLKGEAEFIHYVLRLAPFCMLPVLISLSVSANGFFCGIGSIWSTIVSYLALNTILGLNRAKTMVTFISSLIIVSIGIRLFQPAWIELFSLFA